VFFNVIGNLVERSRWKSCRSGNGYAACTAVSFCRFVPTPLVAAVRRPVLNQLETQARDANQDVRIAVARYDEARAVFSRFGTRSIPDRHPDGLARQTQGSHTGFTDKPLRSRLRAGFDAIWELDFFWPDSVGSRAARANAESYREVTRRHPRPSVAAEIARNYFELRGWQQRLAVAERNLENQRETLRLTRVRREAALRGSSMWPAPPHVWLPSRPACRRFERPSPRTRIISRF